MNLAVVIVVYVAFLLGYPSDHSATWSAVIPAGFNCDDIGKGVKDKMMEQDHRIENITWRCLTIPRDTNESN